MLLGYEKDELNSIVLDNINLSASLLERLLGIEIDKKKTFNNI